MNFPLALVFGLTSSAVNNDEAIGLKVHNDDSDDSDGGDKSDEEESPGDKSPKRKIKVWKGIFVLCSY